MKVAVGVIFDKEKRVLITQRPEGKPYAGYWEFPGGKLEPDELPEDALKREILEEVGLCVTQIRFWKEIIHEQDGTLISLFVFGVDAFEGRAKPCEFQQGIQWVTSKNLQQFKFPPANERIIQLILQ